jgi:hypothetical protein
MARRIYVFFAVFLHSENFEENFFFKVIFRLYLWTLKAIFICYSHVIAK